MAGDWTKLAKEINGKKNDTENDNILIGKIDCTKRSNRHICEHYEIKSFPTLMYGNVIDLNVYHGMRTVDDWMDQVIDEHLRKPVCGVKTPDTCSPSTQADISKWWNLGLEGLDQELRNKKAQIRKLEDDFDLKVDKLNEQMEAFVTKHKAAQKDKRAIGSKLKLMKSILALKEEKV